MRRYLIAVLMLLTTHALAEVNKWVDENNHVHYSDQPPPVDAKAKKLRSTSNSEDSSNVDSAAKSSQPARPKTVAEREAELRKAQQEKKQAAAKNAQKLAEEEAKRTNCANAQRRLRTLQDGAPITEIDADGERSYLDDEQRQQRITKTQQDINNLCNY